MTDTASKLTEALAGLTSPTEALVAAHRTAPDPLVSNFIDMRAMEVLMIELPKLKDAVMYGPAILVDEVVIVEKTFTEALEMLPSEVRDEMSATVQDCALELAQLLDKCVKRVLLTDTHAKRIPALDLLSEHAKIVSALTDLALTEAQQAQVDARAEQGSA